MIEGKVAFITGAAKGIGKEVAVELAKRGYHVAINYRSWKEELEELQKEIEEFGIACLLVQGDVSSQEEVEKMIKQIIEKFGKIDVLVNNAGITKDNLLMRMQEQDFDQVIEANLKGTFLVSKQVVPYMMKKREGRIINISSVVGVSGNAGQSNYAASKAGIIGFSKSLAKELASRNILVNVVAPGFIQTDMTKDLSEPIKEKIGEQIPLKRMGSAAEVAKAVAFLAGEDSTYMTGQVLCVDGGMMI